MVKISLEVSWLTLRCKRDRGILLHYILIMAGKGVGFNLRDPIGTLKYNGIKTKAKNGIRVGSRSNGFNIIQYYSIQHFCCTMLKEMAKQIKHCFPHLRAKET